MTDSSIKTIRIHDVFFKITEKRSGCQAEPIGGARKQVLKERRSFGRRVSFRASHEIRYNNNEQRKATAPPGTPEPDSGIHHPDKTEGSHMWNKLKKWAKQLTSQLIVLYYAYQDRRAPWYARLFVLCIVAYAFSPIDPIPDFIPLLGYLDEVILLPLLIALAIKMIPDPILADARTRSKKRSGGKRPRYRAMAVLMILFWLGIGVLLVVFLTRWLF